MKRFHLAIGVEDVEASVEDYTRRLGAEPVLIIPGRYALWRTPQLNFSIRHIPGSSATLRHVGWEDPEANTLSVEHDVNGLVWERFTAQDQAREIRANWPDVQYRADEP
ncbi:MAG: hypothetical protein JJT90_07675 [Ectothiorhodospiraceae bacterium]|nr:hypothetical protein [Ectothiorhodospiraceae bacterium]